ncbi:MAG: ATP-dependent protease ATPase subunit HslU [Thermaerobacter sp.]|nr:ATP-dependent protease ATPase subunit HslU [Thermaerobacter sp.]
MTAAEIVLELNRFVIGQEEAKRKVAIALRNRERRERLQPGLREEVTPKNILMIGPTGVGKTEIARRLARLVGAPFTKVEVTRFTEVGYVGRDVESIIRDLAEVAVRLVREEMRRQIEPDANVQAEDRLVELMLGETQEPSNPFASIFGFGQNQQPKAERMSESERQDKRRDLRDRLRRGELEDEIIEVEVEEQGSSGMPFLGDGQNQMQEMLQQMMPKRTRRRRLTVREARPIVRLQEADRLIDQDKVAQEAVRRTEQSGIVFLDEIDKVAAHGAQGPDVSREGVQRDLLPIVEGTTVSTKYGPVRTEHILFIAAGAFHIASPQDLIPELQGRFPIRVELRSLGVEDLRRILVEPEHALVRQYEALLETDGVALEVSDDAVLAIAEFAHRLNEETEDIGARRLHTLLERCLEDALYRAPDPAFSALKVDRAYVERQLGEVAANPELSRYIL